MLNKTICVAIAGVAALVLMPGCTFASNYGGSYDGGYHGYNRDGNRSNYNYNYGGSYGGKYYNYNDYGSTRVLQDNSRRNAAAYPGYVPSNYYGNCYYNYGYAYNNCYQTGQTYYYNSGTYCPQTAAANCPCQNQYYYRNYTPAYWTY